MKNQPIQLAFLLFASCTSSRYGHRMLRVKANSKEVVKTEPAPQTKVIDEPSIAIKKGTEEHLRSRRELTALQYKPWVNTEAKDEAKIETSFALTNKAQNA